jgi:hypothetical protein
MLICVELCRVDLNYAILFVELCCLGLFDLVGCIFVCECCLRWRHALDFAAPGGRMFSASMHASQNGASGGGRVGATHCIRLPCAAKLL